MFENSKTMKDNLISKCFDFKTNNKKCWSTGREDVGKFEDAGRKLTVEANSRIIQQNIEIEWYSTAPTTNYWNFLNIRHEIRRNCWG